MQTVLYDVAFYRHDTSRKLHLIQHGKPIAVVRGREDSDTFRAYHMHAGTHYVPDYAAIRAALPHYHRAAFDRAGPWWFPLTLRSALSHAIVLDNACSVSLHSSRGKLLGTIYATPYLA